MPMPSSFTIFNMNILEVIMDNTIYYVSACAGSGKTTTALRSIEKGVRFGERFIIAQPTTALCRATADQLSTLGVKPHLIVSDKYPGAVRSEFVKAVHSARDRVLIITHAMLLMATEIGQKAKWNLIVDEVLPIDVSLLRNVSLTYGEIIKHLDITPNTANDSILDVQPKNSSKRQLTAWARNVPGDDNVKVLQPFWQMVINPHYAVGINRQQHALSASATTTQLIAHAVLMPTVLAGWARVTIMGANFEKSLMYRLWAAKGISFVPDPTIMVSNPKHSAATGSRVTIRYLTDANWTKSLCKKIGGIAAVSAALAPHISGDYIWAANKDINDSDWKIGNGTRVPVMAQGLNQFRHHTQAIFVAALNDNPAHIRWAQAQYGIDALELSMAKSMETAYQMVMRTSLRDPASNNPVTLTVMDRRTADYLAELLPTATAKFLDVGIARLAQAPASLALRPPAQTTNERKNRHDAHKRKHKEAIEGLKTLTGGVVASSGGLPMAPLVSFETDKFSRSVLAQQFRDFDELKDLLRTAWETKISRKEESLLMSGAVFSPGESSQTTKGLDAFVFAQMMQLDFDDSELAPEFLRELFWDIRHLAYNSYSNVTQPGHYRYRVVIPLTTPVTKDIYEALWDLLARRIAEAGYSVSKEVEPRTAKSGLDRSKRTPVSWMYMPARASAPRNSFWLENWDAPMMDPEQFVDRLVFDDPALPIEVAEPVSNCRRNVDRDADTIDVSSITPASASAHKGKAIAAALDNWRGTPAGCGNDAFFRLGIDLRRAGCSLPEIQSLLSQHHADSASKSSDRRKQIPGIIRSLERQRRFSGGKPQL
jgi:hypothetical protein